VTEITRRVPLGIRPIQRALGPLPFSADPTRYDRMPYRKCGISGLKLPAVSLGAWETFGSYRGAEISRECIFRAFNLGITHFDLANNYGRPPGRAETVVGKILCEMPRHELIVSTKAGFPMWPGPYGEGGSRKSLLTSIDQSLRRLGLDYIDIFYSHRHNPETPLEETLGALDQIVRTGKALYVGLSNYSGKLLEEAAGLARTFRLAPIIVEQSSYSLLNRRVESELFPSVRTAGIGVIAFSPLAQGLLSEKYLDGFPEGSRIAKTWTAEQRERITPAFREKIRKLTEMAKARNQTLPQMALAWVLRRPEIASALVGASGVDQIEENVKALENLKFSEEELSQIDQVCAI
jgi:L-glyceraldehyde 3-phosphate reductase